MTDELNSWKFRHLTILGKIIVIKTLCLPKFTHIAAGIPNLCITKLSKIEGEWELQPGGGQEYEVLPKGREWTRHVEAGSILAVSPNVLALELLNFSRKKIIKS